MAGVIYFGLDANPACGQSAYGEGYVNTALYWAFSDALEKVLLPICPEEYDVIVEAKYMGIISFIDLDAPSYCRVVGVLRDFFGQVLPGESELNDAKWVWDNVGEPMVKRDNRYAPP